MILLLLCYHVGGVVTQPQMVFKCKGTTVQQKANSFGAATRLILPIVRRGACKITVSKDRRHLEDRYHPQG